MDAQYLLQQYVDTGLRIPKYQFDKLNNNLRKTYIRKREIAIMNYEFPQQREDPDDIVDEVDEDFLPLEYEINYFNDDVLSKLFNYDPNYFKVIKKPCKS